MSSSLFLAATDFTTLYVSGAFGLLVVVGGLVFVLRCFRTVEQGTALVRNGWGGTHVSFSKLLHLPILHRTEHMDISVKRIEIDRNGHDGLICKDNIRADIKVVFFVRVNKSPEGVEQVAQLLGCKRASDQIALVALFEPKFSEALKSVGKQFDFVDLYSSREKFREEIKKVIGTDLNGYMLDDAAIDYLEQTALDQLNTNNVLDAEGIKKITDLTAREQVLANQIRRSKEMTITKQDVEAREAILNLERQQAEAEEKQHREIAEIQARQRAEALVVGNQERQRSELSRITADEEISIAEENRLRTIIVAAKAKERTDAVETERVEKDRGLEITERERVVTLAQIAKEKAVEVEKKNIQDVIRERIVVERAVVEEEEKIKDTREFATADRKKQVAVTAAEEVAQQALVKTVKASEAERDAAELEAKTIVIRADARKTAAERDTDAKKMLADAVRVESAALGLGEADVLQKKAEAEARGKEALAVGVTKEGEAEARVLEVKFAAEAKGITEKAEAMKLFDSVGKEHEEFKLRLNKDKEIELQAIATQHKIAEAQARMLGEALKSANIDIVGGDNQFFDSLVRSITAGKQIDRLVGNSSVLTGIGQKLASGDAGNLREQIQQYIELFGVNSNDVKNLTISALVGQWIVKSDEGIRADLISFLQSIGVAGIGNQKLADLGVAAAKTKGKS